MLITIDLSHVNPEILNYVKEIVQKNFDEEFCKQCVDNNQDIQKVYDIMILVLFIEMCIYSDIFSKNNISHIQLHSQSSKYVQAGQDHYNKMTKDKMK